MSGASCFLSLLAPPALPLALPLCETKVSYIARTLPKKLIAERGKLGSCYACLIAVFGQSHLQLAMGQVVTGLKIKLFSREPNCIFKSYLKVFCIENSISLSSRQKFEGAAGEFKGALGSWHPLKKFRALGYVARCPSPYLCDIIEEGRCAN